MVHGDPDGGMAKRSAARSRPRARPPLLRSGGLDVQSIRNGLRNRADVRRCDLSTEKGSFKEASESDLLFEYRDRAEAWSSHAGGRAADRLLAEQAVYARRIVQTVEGRLALEGLVSTGSPGAQLLAAHAVYAWNRLLAAAAMERLASDELVHPIVRSYAKDLRQDLKRQFESRPAVTSVESSGR